MRIFQQSGFSGLAACTTSAPNLSSAVVDGQLFEMAESFRACDDIVFGDLSALEYEAKCLDQSSTRSHDLSTPGSSSSASASSSPLGDAASKASTTLFAARDRRRRKEPVCQGGVEFPGGSRVRLKSLEGGDSQLRPGIPIFPGGRKRSS